MCAVGEGAVEEVRVARDPANVGSAEVDIALWLDIKDVLEGRGGVDHVPGLGMQDTLGLSCRS